MKAKVKAEYYKPELIIVKTPGIETLFGNYFPRGALFMGPFDRNEAMEEHRNFIKELKKHSKQVYSIDEILLEGTVDKNNQKIEGKKLDDLRELTKLSVFLDSRNFNLYERKKAITSLDYSIDLMSVEDLLNTIYSQPSVDIFPTNHNTKMAMNVSLSPIYNMMFIRDQQIITDKGIIIGNMNSRERMSETEIMKLVFDKLGITNIYELGNGEKLEGGDFIPAGDMAFIGQGLRTKEGAIKEILNISTNNYGKPLLKYDTVVVVKDPLKHQDEMHLDTYMNVVDERKVVILEDRINHYTNRGIKKTANPKKELLADIYKKRDDGYYKLIRENKELGEFLVKEQGFKIIPISLKEQRAYGINFLTIDKNKVIGVDIAAKEDLKKEFIRLESKYGKSFNYFDINQDYNKLGKEFLNKMTNNDIEYISIKFNALNMLYGSTHCSTQTIKRKIR